MGTRTFKSVGSGGTGTKIALDTTAKLATPGVPVSWTIPIPGGILGINNAIRFTMLFPAYNFGGGGGSGVTASATYGGNPIGTVNVSSGVNSGSISVVLGGFIVAQGTPNAQEGGMTLLFNDLATGSGGGKMHNSTSGGNPNVDSTILQNLVITLTAPANTSFGADGVLVEKII